MELAFPAVMRPGKAKRGGDRTGAPRRAASARATLAVLVVLSAALPAGCGGDSDEGGGERAGGERPAGGEARPKPNRPPFKISKPDPGLQPPASLARCPPRSWARGGGSDYRVYNYPCAGVGRFVRKHYDPARRVQRYRGFSCRADARGDGSADRVRCVRGAQIFEFDFS